MQPGGVPPSRDEYEKVGRSSLRALLAGDPGQEFRVAVAGDDGVWKQMKGIGNRAQFAPLFGLSAGSIDPRVEAAGADYSAITSWAEAMVEAGKATQQVDELLSGSPVTGVVEEEQDRSGRIELVKLVEASDKVRTPFAQGQPEVPLSGQHIEAAEHRLLPVGAGRGHLPLLAPPLILAAKNRH